MKTVYFVRHGESEGNVGDIRQDGTFPLTQNGREQAAIVADRLTTYPIDVILSSSMKRAMQTADIIADRIKKPIERSDLLAERRRPSEQLGASKDTIKAAEIDTAIRENFNVPDFRFSDEENFEDLNRRAHTLLQELAERPENCILVVTHDFFMRMVIGHLTMAENFTPLEGQQFIRTFHMHNTGITTIRRNKRDNLSAWDLLTWNDCSHLSNINN